MPFMFSLRTVLTIWVVMGLLIPISLGTFYSLKKQTKELVTNAHDAHRRLTEMMALGVQKALWDLSPEAAIPLVNSALKDQRVVEIKIVDAKRQVFYEARGHAASDGHTVHLERPVHNDAEPIGYVTVSFSLNEVESLVQISGRDALVLGAGQALICILILTIFLSKRVITPISNMRDQAVMLENKNLTTPFIWKGRDEISQLGGALESTRIALSQLFEDIEQKNNELGRINENLEKMVEERTATIKMILDHVKVGFLLVDHELRVLPGYTKSCEALLDHHSLAGQSLMALLRTDKRTGEHLQCCMEQVFEDMLPEIISLDQITSRHHVLGKTISLEASSIRNKEGQVDRLLLTLIDVTRLDQIEKENQQNRSMVKIMSNIEAFRQLMLESKRRIMMIHERVGLADETVARHEIHTLKGNFATFGIDQLVRVLHDLETYEKLPRDAAQKIDFAISTYLNDHFDVFHITYDKDLDPIYTVSRSEIEASFKSMSQLKTCAQWEQFVHGFLRNMQTLEAGKMLAPLIDYVPKLAKDMGKQAVLLIEGKNIKIAHHVLNELGQSLIHLVRNSIDHGIERPFERGAKPNPAHIWVRMSQDQENITISISDDGAGIDTEALKLKAASRQLYRKDDLAQLSDQEACELIFVDGLSTAQHVSEISGRGVGVSAVKSAVEKLGGHIKVTSRRGQGTTFLLTIPRGFSEAANPLHHNLPKAS